MRNNIHALALYAIGRPFNVLVFDFDRQTNRCILSILHKRSSFVCYLVDVINL